MVKINGKEYKLAYTIGVMVAYNNWLVAHPKASYVDGVIWRCIYMIKAYNDIHQIKDNAPKYEELMGLPGYVFNDILEEVEKVEKEGSERKVEAEPVKGKKGAGTAQ